MRKELEKASPEKRSWAEVNYEEKIAEPKRGGGKRSETRGGNVTLLIYFKDTASLNLGRENSPSFLPRV